MRTDTQTIAEGLDAIASDTHLRDSVRHSIAEAAARLREFQAVVDKLPRTADGVRVTPGMLVYTNSPDVEWCAGIEISDLAGHYSSRVMAHEIVGKCFHPMGQILMVYATRAAAEAAKGGAA